MKPPLHLIFLSTALLVLPTTTNAFTEILPHLDVSIPLHASLDLPFLLQAKQVATGSTLNPFGIYMNTLAAHPLPTKMATGATLALTGDWIAQSRVPEEPYDKRRAASFALFDSAYRASQHVLYPLVVAYCQGQFLNGNGIIDKASAAAMEQTLVSQLVIVPLLYYPVFYAVTSFVQGLTWEGTVERAQQTFLPLMKRNLMFWIPVQFVQFSFLPEDLQIPFLSVCGLCWTLILSIMAGSAKNYSKEPSTTTTSFTSTETEEDPYCVSGMEEGCLIDEDDLFPEATFEAMTEEMIHLANDVTHEWEEMTHRVMGDSDEDNHNDASLQQQERELVAYNRTRE